MISIGKKYVAFCDILGFSNAVLNQFDTTIEIYRELKKELDGMKKSGVYDLEVSVYSDSILIVSDDLYLLCDAVQILLWTTLRNRFLVRGGIAYGRHWEERNTNNLLVVSEALVKAVTIEQTVQHPVIKVHDDIEIEFSYWGLGFEHSVFDLPIIHYNEMNIVNPFNNYFANSAVDILKEIKEKFPEYKVKPEYLLTLINDIKKEKIAFISPAFIEFLLKDQSQNNSKLE